MAPRWHIVTPELPPGCGGVGDYTAQLAEALAAGGPVVVYGPPAARRWAAPAGVDVVTLADRFGHDAVRQLAAGLDRDPDARLLVQYVPAVFGRRGANLAFCRWLRGRRRDGRDVRVMFHEPYLYWTWRPDHIITAIAQRAMAATLLDAATCTYLATDTWRRYLAPLGAAAIQRATTLPIPSAIPRVHEAAAVEAARRAVGGDRVHFVGHFGSYGSHVAPLVRKGLHDLLSGDDRIAALCMGAGSEAFVASMLAERPGWRGRLFATGRASAREISLHMQSCDLLLQPYPDGVTTRRTSAMAGLANGRAVLTTDGALTEEVWRETAAVALVPAHRPETLAAAADALLHDPVRRASLAARASATYDARFDLRHTIDALVPAMPGLQMYG